MSREWVYLKDLNIEIIQFSLKELSLSTPIVLESDLGITSSRTERIIDICKKLKANTYLSGSGGKDYLNEALFARDNIKLIYQDFKHPQYQQCSVPFEPYMSIIDLLFNYGEGSKEILFPKKEMT